jgi:5-methylcytosine-specific restriction endonuclease McrA
MSIYSDNPEIREKVKADYKIWYLANKKHKLKKTREWEAKNPEKVKLQQAKQRTRRKEKEKQNPILRKRNKERNKVYRTRYRNKNLEKVQKWNKDYAIKHKEKINLYNKGWRERNKDKWNMINRITKHKRRALGSINSTEWIAKVAMLENKCQGCFKTEPEIKITIDHIVPVSRGGTNHIDNLQPLCMQCNRFKGNKIKFSLLTLVSH